MQVQYCFLWIDWWPLCMAKSEWASWVQALASIAAIYFTLWVALKQWRLRREESRDIAYAIGHDISDELQKLEAQAGYLVEGVKWMIYNQEHLNQQSFVNLIAEFDKLSLRPIAELAPLALVGQAYLEELRNCRNKAMESRTAGERLVSAASISSSFLVLTLENARDDLTELKDASSRCKTKLDKFLVKSSN